MNNNDDRLPKALQGRGFDYDVIKDCYAPGILDDAAGASIRINRVYVLYFYQKEYHCKLCGAYDDLCWAPPNQELKKGDYVYVTVDILHAFSLMHLGKKVIASFTRLNFPKNFIEENISKKIIYQFCALNYSDERIWMAGMVKQCRAMSEKANLYIFDSLWDHRMINKDVLKDAYNRGQEFMESTI